MSRLCPKCALWHDPLSSIPHFCQSVEASKRLAEYRQAMGACLAQGNKRGVRKPKPNELTEVLLLPGDPVPLIRWSATC